MLIKSAERCDFCVLQVEMEDSTDEPPSGEMKQELEEAPEEEEEPVRVNTVGRFMAASRSQPSRGRHRLPPPQPALMCI